MLAFGPPSSPSSQPGGATASSSRPPDGEGSKTGEQDLGCLVRGGWWCRGREFVSREGVCVEGGSLCRGRELSREEWREFWGAHHSPTSPLVKL